MKRKCTLFAILALSASLAFGEVLTAVDGVTASDVVDAFIEKIGELPFGYCQVYFLPSKEPFFKTYDGYDDSHECYFLTLEVPFGSICVDNFTERSERYKSPFIKHDMRTQKGRLGFANEMVSAIESYPTDFVIDEKNHGYVEEQAAAFKILMSRLSEEERSAYKRLMNFFEQLSKMLK